MSEARQTGQQESRQKSERQETRPEPLSELMRKSDQQRAEMEAIKSKTGYRFCALITRIMDDICRGNMYSYIGAQSIWSVSEINSEDASSESSRVRSRHTKQSDALSECAFGRKRKITPEILLSRLLLVLCLACEIGIGMSIYFQYSRDYYQFHLDRLNTSLFLADHVQTPLPQTLGQRERLSYEQAHALEKKLRLKEQEASASLKIVGSFLRDHSYFCEMAYLFSALLCACAYLAPMVYYRRKGSLDFYHIRMMLDWEQEQRNCNRMIECTIKQLALSSENFSYIARQRGMIRSAELCYKAEPKGCTRLHETPFWLRRKDKQSLRFDSRRFNLGRTSEALTRNISDFHSADSSVQSTCFDEHKWVLERLKHLALTGQLQPLNRTGVDEMTVRMFQYATLGAMSLGLVVVWDSLLYSHLLPVYFGFSYNLDYMDQLTVFEVATLNALMSISASFYIGLVIVHCREQVILMRKLRKMIISFVVSKRRLLDGLQPIDGTQSGYQAPMTGANFDELYATINSDLLLILMHYRIFATEQRPTRRALGFVLLCTIGLLVALPIIGRLHLPYVRYKAARVVCVIVCLIMIAGGDMAIVTICWMNSRCLDLYKSLWNLMASLVSIAEHPKYGFLLSGHSVWLLRQELSQPDRLKSQFAIVTLGVEFTYAELLKLHFWLALVVLSFSYDLASSSLPEQTLQPQKAQRHESVLSHLFSDPLGIISGFEV